MSKEEFLDQLEKNLNGMPNSEKQEAIQYYKEYFEDAGEDKEEEVLKSLGDPALVARNIMSESGSGFTGNAWSNYSGNSNGANLYQNGTGQYNSASDEKSDKEKERTKILIIVLLVLTSPLWIPAFFSLIGVLLGLIGGFIGFAVGGAGMIIGGIVAVIAGIIALCSGWASYLGMMIIGAGLMIFGLGTIFVLITVLICRYLIPLVIDGIKWLWNKLFGKKVNA